METELKLPAIKRAVLSSNASLLSTTLRLSTHLPDDWLVGAVRRLTGTNQFPMGQKFLERALLTLKRAIGRANPRSRAKMIQNLVINEMVRGQAQRNWITEQLGYEIPLLLVVSPTILDAVMVSQTGEPAVVEVANINTTAVIEGIGGSLPAGRYVNVAVVYRERYCELQVCDPSVVARSLHPLSERRLPVTQRILEEHAGLLRITDLPEGRTRVEVFLPSAGRQAGERSTQHHANEWQ